MVWMRWPLGFRERRACGFADPADRQDRRAIEARWKIGRGGMCQVVGYEMKFLSQRPSKNFLGDAAHLAKPELEGLLKLRIPPFGAILLAPLRAIEGVGD